MQPELKPVRTDDQGFGRGTRYEPVQDVAVTDQGQKVLRNTYMLLALTMVPTVIGAWIGMATSSIITTSPIISTLVMLAAVIGLQFGIAANRNSGVGVALLLLMTGLLGWWLGPILNVALSMKNGMALVGYAAVGTGVIFFAMGALAQTIKRDLSFMGKFLFVGMIALLIAMIANMFLQIPALALTISTLVIVVFSLFLLYDLQRIMRGGETNYVMATTGVYMSLFNIFANLFLQIPALALTISTLVIVVFSLFLLYDVSRIVNGGETNYIMATTGVYLSLFNIFANLLQLLMALTGDRD
jgi:modulator of FtsH protease